MSRKERYRRPEFLISALGLAALAAVWVRWFLSALKPTLPGTLASLAAAVLFALVCLRFVPVWMDSWRGKAPEREAEGDPEPPAAALHIFAALFLLDALVILLTWGIWRLTGWEGGFRDYLEFWRCTDSGQYLDIARDWYVGEGDRDALVRLVFLPGYPLLVRLFRCVLGSDLASGLTVSALAFSGAGAALYRLLRLDLPHRAALRGVKYFCLLPGVFFFVAPMSDGLFVFLCAMALYLARKGKWAVGCFFGGCAAFTRSLGLTLLAPMAFLLISEAVRDRNLLPPGRRLRKPALQTLALLLVPAGFGVYCFINWQVTGDPLKFLEYQSSHWHQQLGWFFHTAAYQTDYALEALREDPETLLGLWLPNLLFHFGALLLMLSGAKRMRPEYTAWFLVYYVLAYGAAWLLSGPRYMIALIPVPLGLALLTESRAADRAATLCCGVLSILYLIAFVERWQVW